MKQPWKTQDWFVSPWNFQPEVTEDWDFPDRIQVHDITLRDGEQQAGIVLTKDEKVRIAAKLAEAGVHRIEAGMPAVSPADEAAIKEIVKLNLGPKIFAFARCMKDDVKRARDCGVDGIVVEIPSSEHIIRTAYRWPLEKAIDLSIEATKFAHEQGLYTAFFPIDASRAEMGWFLDLIERVATEGHMDSLVLVDTFGVLSLHAVPYLVRKVRERIDKPLEAHFHADFGHGAANTVLAVASGVEVVHTTVLGVGERAGNAALGETVLSLKMLYGQDLDIKFDKLYELATLVKELTRQPVPLNRPIVGDLLFSIESGIITSWLANCGDEYLTEVFPFRPSFVGQASPDAVLGKGSGLPSVQVWLDKMGIQATDEERSAILMKVKARSLETKCLLTYEEFSDIVHQVMG